MASAHSPKPWLPGMIMGQRSLRALPTRKKRQRQRQRQRQRRMPWTPSRLVAERIERQPAAGAQACDSFARLALAPSLARCVDPLGRRRKNCSQENSNADSPMEELLNEDPEWELRKGHAPGPVHGPRG